MGDIYSTDDGSYEEVNKIFLEGKDLLLNHHVEGNVQKALEKFETAAFEGHVRAMYNAGAIRDSPVFAIDGEYGKGWDWLVMAAEKGDWNAAQLLHEHYYQGLYEIDSETMDFDILRALALSGYSDAKSDLQVYLKNGVDGWYQNGELADMYYDLRI